MQPFETEIQTLAAAIWEQMLNLPLEAADAPIASAERTLAAYVLITGAWEGAVALSCDAALAERASAIMFNLSHADISIADMQDALGELANMIGGNVKGLLPETCHLSLPAVVEGSNYSTRIPGSDLLSSVPFTCGQHRLWISLLQRKAA